MVTPTEIRHGVVRCASHLLGVKNVCVTVVLNGGFMFAADLLRELPDIAEVRFIRIDRGYSLGKTKEPRIVGEAPSFFSKDVHVFLDVVAETGETFELLRDLAPSRLTCLTCALVVNGKGYTPDIFGIRLDGSMFLYGYGMGPRRHLCAIYGRKK